MADTRRVKVMGHAAPLILASASPRRSQLLRACGVRLDVIPSPLPEPSARPETVTPVGWAMALAYYKARSVADIYLHRDVIGADTIVECGGCVLGKAADQADARRMLEAQAGVPSRVVTGVALVRVGDGGEVVRRIVADVTIVWMRDDRAARERYLASGNWEGKAGAYGIQEIGDELVERIEGAFDNVVGLPMRLVGTLIRQPGKTC